MRWSEGPSHLTLNLSCFLFVFLSCYFVLFLLFFCFVRVGWVVFVVLVSACEQKHCFPVIMVSFWCSVC